MRLVIIHEIALDIFVATAWFHNIFSKCKGEQFEVCLLLFAIHKQISFVAPHLLYPCIILYLG